MTPLLMAITDREEQVLLMIADGRSYDEIGVTLGITERTVRAHRENARRKLNAASTSHAVAIIVRIRSGTPA